MDVRLTFCLSLETTVSFGVGAKRLSASRRLSKVVESYTLEGDLIQDDMWKSLSRTFCSSTMPETAIDSDAVA